VKFLSVTKKQKIWIAAYCFFIICHYLDPRSWDTPKMHNYQKNLDVIVEKKMVAGKEYRFSVLWNLFLITTGTFLLGVGVKAIAIPHGFITGGMSGCS
jgi:hypothetical protein